MRERKPKGWLKREIKSLRGAIDHWWTFNAMYLREGVTKAHVFATMPAGERARICASHFRGFSTMFSERAESSRATAAHYETKRGIAGWGDVTEVVKRFNVMAADDELAAIAALALVRKVEEQGLPPEVESYIPER